MEEGEVELIKESDIEYSSDSESDTDHEVDPEVQSE